MISYLTSVIQRWIELKHIVLLADEEVNGNVIRQASYKIIK